VSEPDLYGEFVKWMVPIMTVAFAYILQRTGKKSDELREKTQQVHEDLMKHKLEVSQNYASKESLQASLSRLYDCMDSGFREVRQDIKSILQSGGTNGKPKNDQ
jgi:hypothetical protein